MALYVLRLAVVTANAYAGLWYEYCWVPAREQ